MFQNWGNWITFWLSLVGSHRKCISGSTGSTGANVSRWLVGRRPSETKQGTVGTKGTMGTPMAAHGNSSLLSAGASPPSPLSPLSPPSPVFKAPAFFGQCSLAASGSIGPSARRAPSAHLPGSRWRPHHSPMPLSATSPEKQKRTGLISGRSAKQWCFYGLVRIVTAVFSGTAAAFFSGTAAAFFSGIGMALSQPPPRAL